MNSKGYYVKLGFEIDSASLTNLQSQINQKVNTNSPKIKIGIDGVESANSSIKTLEETLKQYDLTVEQFKNNFRQVKATFKDNDTQIVQYKSSLGETLNLTQQMSNTNNVLKSSFTVVQDEINDTTASIKNASFATGNWMYDWGKAFQSFVTYSSVTEVFYQAKAAITSMIEEVTELDSALTELKKVTDLEGESLENFVDEAYSVGSEVAKTGTEMVEAATSFAKAGYGEDEILQLGKVATMYQNIADEEISSGDAADFIIAQLKAFNLESENVNETLENSYHIIDAVNEVSNSYAVSSADIANNLGKASSVMANAGNSLEQMIGLMTAGTEVTRNASRVANGKKTKPYIYSNMYINIILNPVILKASMATT